MPRSGQGRSMGLDFGLADPSTCFKKKNRWIFTIPGIIADAGAQGVNSLPPLRSARPSISFKEIEVQHVTETIYYPGKPEWKPLVVTLYDLKKNVHPIFEWLSLLYGPRNDAKFIPSCEPQGNKVFKQYYGELQLLNGCGEILERWIYEGIWPQTVDFGELDMSNSEVITCDLTLRYDRAYIA